jgi:hypothetical protein
MCWLSRLVADQLWPRLEAPLVEIVVHLIVTALSIISIYGIEILLRALGLGEKLIPIFGVTLNHWMFGLEVVAATAIIAVGIVRATIALVRS